MTMHLNTKAPSWAAKTLATLVAGLVLAFSLPTLALAQSSPAPGAASAAAPAPVPAAPAAAPATPTITEEAVENPYGLKALWTQGDMVAHSTLVILLIMSMGSWYVIFTKLWEQHAMLKSGRESADAFWKASSVKAGLTSLQEGSAFRYIADQAIRASDHHEGTMVESIDKHTWISMSVDRAAVSYTHLDVYKRQVRPRVGLRQAARPAG